MSPAPSRRLKMYAPYGVLAVVVLAPLLASGYILTLDAVFTPHIAAPRTLGSDYLWQWLLHTLNFAVPSQVLEKMIFGGIVLGSGVGMHRLIDYVRSRTAGKELRWSWAPYVGGVLYTANPFTYDRFMAGQYGILLGYALLPFAFRLVLEFSEKPARREALRLALITVVISIVSLPTVGEFALLAACVILASAWQKRRQRQALKQYVRWGITALGVFALLSCYWLLPLAAGKGATAASIHEFTGTHTAAFATGGSNAVARLLAALRLQGFWAESHHLFTLPQDKLPGWGTVRLLVWALVVLGAVALWRRSRHLAAACLAVLSIGALLAAGLFSAQLTRVGYREPQKFAGLVALVFALFAAFGAARLQAWAAQRRSEVWQAALPAILVLVVVLFTPTMYWGFAGQLTPRHYPTGWFAANDYLRQQQGSFNAVFLPWHQYMSFTFAGRIIASPGAKFFPDTIVSNNPEIGNIQPPANNETTRIGQLVRPRAPSNALAAQLQAHNVRYILLAKDYDYHRYTYLSETPHIRLVKDTASIAVYENLSWKEGN